MQITNYEVYEVPLRWQFLEIETDEGLVGWGESGLSWHPAAVSGSRHRHDEAAVEAVAGDTGSGGQFYRLEDGTITDR